MTYTNETSKAQLRGLLNPEGRYKHAREQRTDEPTYVHTMGLLAEQEHNPIIPGTAIAQVTDFDHTFWSGQAHMGGTVELIKHCKTHNIPLIHMTGNDLLLLQEKIRTERIPYQPDIVIGAVGTEITLLQPDGTYVHDAEWERSLREDHDFVRVSIYPICEQVVRQAQDVVPGAKLEFQPRDSAQNIQVYGHPETFIASSPEVAQPPEPFKISFRFNGEEHREPITALFKRLTTTHPNIRVVICYDSVLPGGVTRYNIDVVPVTKAEAAEYILGKLGCMGILSGDSGNDAEALIDSDHNNILLRVLVGGSKVELLERVNRDNITQIGGGLYLGDKNKLLYLEDGNNIGPESINAATRSLISLFS